MSHAWAQFDAFFLNANSWPDRKDGYPDHLIAALSPEEKERAGAILIQRLDGGDGWPVRAMAQLGVKESVPQLRKLLLLEHAWAVHAAAATAIFKLTGDARMERIVAEIAKSHAVFWVSRIDAIYCLAQFKTPTSVETLSELTQDSEYLVRYNAKRAGEIFK